MPRLRAVGWYCYYSILTLCISQEYHMSYLTVYRYRPGTRTMPVRQRYSGELKENHGETEIISPLWSFCSRICVILTSLWVGRVAGSSQPIVQEFPNTRFMMEGFSFNRVASDNSLENRKLTAEGILNGVIEVLFENPLLPELLANYLLSFEFLLLRQRKEIEGMTKLDNFLY